MDMNFSGAHNFAINGGNFGTINGGVNNYTLTPGSLASPVTLGLNSTATGLLGLPPSQGNHVGGGAIHSVPSTPATSHPNLSPASSANNTPSPTSTTSTASSGSHYDFSSRRSSATPATDFEEHRYSGTPPYQPQPTQQPDLLTPLTGTLGLRRFTPSSQGATLSPYQTPQQDTTEFPGSPRSTGQVPTPPLPPQIPRNTQSNNQVPALSFTPQPPQNTQFLDHNSPSALTPHPVDFPVYRAPSVSPNGSDAGSRSAHSPPIPPYPQNSPPPFDSSPLSPRTANLPQSPVDPDDPSVIFQRLRADTKGYANPLHHPNDFHYTPSPSQSARRSSPRQAEVPQVGQAPELAAPQSSHWTPNVISDWTNHVSQGDSGARPVYDYQNQPRPQHRGSRPLPSPPVPHPQAPANSFPFAQRPQQYPIHADAYHAPSFRQPQYQDNQSWPIFAPAMHPPHPFPPQQYPTHPNRLQYNQPQPSYHPEMNYGSAPNFPMAMIG